MTAIHQLFGYCVVVALGVVLCEVFGKYVVSCGGESVAAHTAVVALLVGGLACGRQSYDNVAWTDVCIVDYIGATHTACDGTIDDDGAHEIAYIGCLASCAIDADSHLTEFCHQFIGSVDDGRYDFAWDEHLVAPDGRADEDIIDSTHAEQVVGIHDEGILCDTFPYGEVARLAPITWCLPRRHA